MKEYKNVNVRIIKPLWKRVLLKPYVLFKLRRERKKRQKTDITNRLRPNFLIVGAQKSGTSSLFDYIVQHPNVSPPERKEIHYFDYHLDWGLNWYLSHFPKKKHENNITGEASPSYLIFENAPTEIKLLFPDIKIIIILRDPVQRAISQYKMEKFRGLEKLNFAKAIREEDNRILKSDHFRVRYGYVEQGKYLTYLENYYNCFDKSNILVINSEFFFKRTDYVVKKVFEFLNIDSTVKIQTKHMNNSKLNFDASLAVIQDLQVKFQGQEKKIIDFLKDKESIGW